MTFLDDGGEGGSYSSKSSLLAQRMMVVKLSVCLSMTRCSAAKVFSMFMLQKHFLCFNTMAESASNLGNFPNITSPHVIDSREKRNQG
jgi:hypothetical protein